MKFHSDWHQVFSFVKIVSTEVTDHTNCPQSKFQAKQNNFKQRNNWQCDIDVREGGCGKKIWSKLNANNGVATHNRFAGLSDNYQGNY